MTALKTDTQHKRLLFVVSAPSGAGKTSLCNEVISQIPNLRFSISHTTRPPRPGEEHGKDYCFISSDTFHQYIAQGKMAELQALSDSVFAENSGDFGEQYAGYRWKTSVADVSSEVLGEVAQDLKRIDVTVSTDNDQFSYSLRTYRFNRD